MSSQSLQLSAAILAILAVGGAGALAGWLVYRRTNLSPRNWYLAAGVTAVLLVLGLLADLGARAELALGALFGALSVASLLGHRWRLSALGGTGELREYESARVMIWRARIGSGRRSRTRIASQGELVMERRWPAELPYVPLGRDEGRARVPRGEGRHILVLGGTGSGKTVSADRIALGRVLADRVPALVLDPKGDERLIRDLASLASYVERPFIVFDPLDEASDRWDPLWSAEPGRTVARVVSPIQTSEPYYADTLRIHLGVVAEALQLLGLWPASVPLLLEAAQAQNFASIRDLALAQGGPPALLRTIDEQAALVSSRSGERDIASGAARLRVVVGTSWRQVLTPREDRRAVQLPSALRAGAIVLWRTWVEDLPEEAEAITTLALADMIAAAAELRGETEWLVVLDEFGSVLEGNAARRALGILGRARSAGGQAIVVTQSAADVPTATGSDALLESLADNFSGFVVHRQTSAESREWVAKLIGTRELWQSTDRTGGGGRFAEGAGSRRRVREFVVRPDALKELGVGEAYVWAPGGPAPELVDVAIAPRLLDRRPASTEAAYRDAGPTSLADHRPPQPVKSDGKKLTPIGAAAERRANKSTAETEESDTGAEPARRGPGRGDDPRI